MTVVPLDLVPEDDDPRQSLPLVQVEVDGEPVTAIVDVGAGTTQLVDRPGLAVRPAAPSPAHGAFGAPTSFVGSARVTCRLGGVTARPVDVDLVERGRSARSNLLGLDVLGQFRCLYRLADAELVLDPDPPATTHPVDLGSNGHVHLATSWPRVTASALFDTGASVTVVGAHLADRHPHLFTRGERQTGTDASGTSAETVLATMRGPSVLGHQLDDALVAIVDLTGLNAVIDRPVDLILGWSLLRPGRVVRRPPRRPGRLPPGLRQQAWWRAGRPPRLRATRRPRCPRTGLP